MIRTISFLLLLSIPLFSNNITLSPEQPVPGSVLVISQPPMEYLRGCSLLKNEKLVFDGYPLKHRNGRIVFVIPVSHTLEAGVYTLSLYYGDGTVLTRPLRIYERDFVSMEIPLNKNMTDLRSTPSREKQRESRELWLLLGRKNSTAVYRDLIFEKPVDAKRITAFYGDRRTYLYSDDSRAKTYHNGIDYAVPAGTPVHAVESGTVVLAKERIITGLTVIVEHGPGIYTLYYHLKSLDVQPQDIVLKGDQIGLSGATGLATGPHLHFEMRVFQVPADPEQFFLSTASKRSLD